MKKKKRRDGKGKEYGMEGRKEGRKDSQNTLYRNSEVHLSPPSKEYSMQQFEGVISLPSQ